MTENDTRHLLVELAASLFARGFSVGSAGNISVRLDDGFIITPTNSCLGRLDPARLSRLDAGFRHIGGDKPSKEVFMHRAFYTGGRTPARWCTCIPQWRQRLPVCPTLLRTTQSRR